MTDLIDQIIQIADEFPDNKARPLIEDLLRSAGLPMLTAKPRNTAVPLTKIATNHTGLTGHKADVYIVQPDKEPTPQTRIGPPDQDEIDRLTDERRRMNEESALEVKKTMFPGS